MNLWYNFMKCGCSRDLLHSLILVLLFYHVSCDYTIYLATTSNNNWAESFDMRWDLNLEIADHNIRAAVSTTISNHCPSPFTHKSVSYQLQRLPSLMLWIRDTKQAYTKYSYTRKTYNYEFWLQDSRMMNIPFFVYGTKFYHNDDTLCGSWYAFYRKKLFLWSVIR
jgi:hypothetical protein